MKDYDYKGIVDTITSAAPSHLALVSFLVLPVVTNYWLETIVKTVPNISLAWKAVSLVFLGAIYIFCLWWLTSDNKKAKRSRRIRDQIVAKMSANEYERIKFSTARSAITSDTTDEEIVAVIEEFPQTLRYVKIAKRDAEGKVIIKDGKKIYEPGIGLVTSKDNK